MNILTALFISMALFSAQPANPETEGFESVPYFVGWSAHAKPNEFKVVNDGCEGTKAIEFTVFPNTWNNDGERAEARWDNEDGEGSVADYSYCFKVPVGYIDSPKWQIMGQWHGHQGSPPIAWYYGYNGVQSGVALYVMGQPVHVVMFNKGEWHEPKLEIKWSTGSDGYIKMWWDGAYQGQYNGPTMLNTTPHYFKAGLYRDPAINTTNKVLYDKFYINRH